MQISIRKIVKVCFWSLLTCILVCIVAVLVALLDSPFDNEKFTRTQWLTAVNRPEERIPMADDVCQTINNTPTQFESARRMLGKPDWKNMGALFYDIGFVPMKGPSYIFVSVNSNTKVAHAKIISPMSDSH